MNLLDSLDATVRRRPDHPALQWGSRSMTYRELREAADRAATVFVKNGVRPGDRVLVMTLNDPGFVVAMYGIWCAGAVLVPVNHKLQPEEISHIVRHSGGVFGVASDAVIDTARQGGPEITWMQTGWEEETSTAPSRRLLLSSVASHRTRTTLRCSTPQVRQARRRGAFTPTAGSAPCRRISPIHCISPRMNGS